MKQRKQLILLCGVLVMLVVGYFILQQFNQIQSEEVEEVTTEMVISIEEDTINKLTYDYNDVTYSFIKDEEGVWRFAEDTSLSIVQSSITSMLGYIANMEASNTITDVTDLSQYGLEEPSRTIQFETPTESYILYAGDYNSMSSVYYICKMGDATVYTVSAMTVDGFNYTLEDLVEVETTTEE